LPHEHTIRLAGVPSDMEVTRSFRQTTDVYYTMPAGMTIFDYDDVDKVYMEPRSTDERIVIGRNNDNEMILIHEVLDPGTQFKPAVLGFKHVVFSDYFVRYYNESGNILFLDTLTLPSVEEASADPVEGYHFYDLGNGVFEIVSDLGDMHQWVDTVSGIVITKYYDEESDWLASNFEFYAGVGGLKSLPSLEITYALDETIMGELAYRVTVTKNTEIYEDNRIENRTIDNFSGSTEHFRVEQLEILPNPATDFISIGFPGLDKPTDVEIKIFAMNGQLMLEETIQADGFHTLVLPAAWPSGMYILNARADHAVWVDKFVKN
jgi:hypothetical protein